ncbi:MAG: ATP-binding cassette domain-containing protein [Bacteroidales bacterium]|jgi:ATP-binding cassette subfamily F protein 3|nr:ATP-binding cassette domain-containing protein [Bacteroidales bacterium]
MISVDRLTVSFGGFDLLKGISFLIAPKDRIGLVGKNGAGKSTLLKILAGLQTPTSGAVSQPKDLNIGYLPQQMAVSDVRTVWDETRAAFEETLRLKHEADSIGRALAERSDYASPEYLQLIDRLAELNDRFRLAGADDMDAELEITLKGLGFSRNDFARNTSEFSGGWRMRIELAKILLRKPDVFLLDEPTNHLDIESIQWLEDFLKNYPGAVVLVSHDRAFLNQVTTRTIEISLGQIYDCKANYDRYLTLRQEHRETQMAAYKNQQKLIEDTEDFIARFRYKPTKSVQVQSRIKMLDRLERIEMDVEDRSRLNIRFAPAQRAGTVVVDCEHLSKKYGSLLVLDDIALTIERGEKVAFVGKNGEGKTTLARIITGELDCSGSMKIGHNVQIGYFAQNQAQRLNENLTVLETVDRIAVGDIRSKLRDLLGAFMFSGDDVDKKVKVLSGGERTRLAMVKLLLEPVNFLVLDEPTNHLDMQSKDMLKQALTAYDGTALIVSHDREFLDGLVNVVYEFRDRKIKQHLGGIYDFLQKKKLESLRDLELPAQSETTPLKPKEPVLQQNTLSYGERKAFSRVIAKLGKTIAAAEQEIEEIERKISELDTLMNVPGFEGAPAIFQTYSDLKARLDDAMLRWTQLGDELEQARGKSDAVNRQ